MGQGIVCYGREERRILSKKVRWRGIAGQGGGKIPSCGQ